jgi:hypothetical protein
LAITCRWLTRYPRWNRGQADQISRQRKEIRSLHRAGISKLPAEALLARMQATVDNLCAERDKLVGEQRVKYPGTDKVIKGPQMRLR